MLLPLPVSSIHAIVVSRCGRRSRSPTCMRRFTALARKAKHFSEIEAETEPGIRYHTLWCVLAVVCVLFKVRDYKKFLHTFTYFTFARPFGLHVFSKMLRQAPPIPFQHTIAVCDVAKCSAGKRMGRRHPFLRFWHFLC